MKELILKLRAEGRSYREICKQVGCSRGTVAYHCGDGQKEKTKNRRDHQTHVICNKIYRFTKALRSKCDDFQRREGNAIGDRNIKFKYQDLLKKFGPEPCCYLTGRKIDLSDTKTYNFDHIVPATRGGSNDIDNLGLTCKVANQCKADMMVSELLEVCKEILEHNGYKVLKQGAVGT